MKTAMRDVLAERRRQVEVKGWTPEHDDAHCKGELADAAACYAYGGTLFVFRESSRWTDYHTIWPFGKSSRFPSVSESHLFSTLRPPNDRRRDLVKAAALLLAEIERLDRSTALSHSAALGGITLGRQS